MPNTGSRSLPLTLEQINAEWLTAALSAGAPGATVECVRITEVIHGTCTKVRLEVELNSAGREAGVAERLLLKGGFEPHSRGLAFLHENEVRAYRDVYSVLPLPVPQCYFAEYVEEQKQGIVILEDLDAKAVQFNSAVRPEGFASMKRRLSAFAKFHAETWACTEFGSDGRWGWLRPAEASLRKYMSTYLVPDEWQRFVNSPRGAATSTHFHDLDTIVEAFDRLVVISEALPHCVLHGDAHLGNTYVYADGAPAFLDSLPGRGPAMKEVTYHMAGALDVADRRRWEGALIQHYLDELERNGVAAPSFDDAWSQYRAFLLDGHIIFMVNESFFQPEAINTAYTARFSAAMVDHDTLGLLLGARS